MVKEIILSAVLLTGCTMFSPQDELFEGLDKPTELEDVDLIVHKVNFLSAGWICAEKAGYPAFLHPLILTIFGCADVQWRNNEVIKCEIWYSVDWALEHELEHCKGWDD